MTYVEGGPHRVSWIYHEGEDWQTGERFCTLPPHLRLHRGRGGKLSAGIRRLHPRLHRRPPRAAEKGGLRRPHLSNVRDPGRPARSRDRRLRAAERFHKFAVQTIANILELDARHPEEWPGNVITGEHRVSVLSTLFQLHPEVVKWYGRLLEESGVIEDFDGEILKLSPQALAA